MKATVTNGHFVMSLDIHAIMLMICYDEGRMMVMTMMLVMMVMLLMMMIMMVMMIMMMTMYSMKVGSQKIRAAELHRVKISKYT